RALLLLPCGRACVVARSRGSRHSERNSRAVRGTLGHGVRYGCGGYLPGTIDSIGDILAFSPLRYLWPLTIQIRNLPAVQMAAAAASSASLEMCSTCPLCWSVL